MSEEIEKKSKHKNVKLLNDCMRMDVSHLQIHEFRLLCTPSFTKLAISPLIMVRFSKFKIWHTLESEADLANKINYFVVNLAKYSKSA